MRSLDVSYPRAFNDIILRQLYDGDDSKYILGSPTNDRYITSSKKNCQVFSLLLQDLDGETSIEALSEKWGRDIEETKSIVDMFFQKGLLVGSSSNNNISEVRKLSIRLLSFECKHLQKISEKSADNILKISLILLIAMFIANMYFVFNDGLKGVNLFRYNGSYFMGLILSSLIMIPSFLIHEFYHSFVALKYGLKPGKIDICLYLLFFPLFYVKIKGMYSTSYKNRMKILCGGFFANLMLADLSLLLFFITRHNIFITIVLSQFNIIIVNCNPFNLTDGYFIGTQLLKTVNLRPKLFNLLANFRKNIRNADKTLIIYALVNFGIIFVNVIYFSNYSLSIITEVLGVNVGQGYLIAYNVAVLFIYYIIIIFRYREKECR